MISNSVSSFRYGLNNIWIILEEYTGQPTYQSLENRLQSWDAHFRARYFIPVDNDLPHFEEFEQFIKARQNQIQLCIQQ